MHNLFNWKFTGGAAVVIVAFCVGIFFYARWDVQRFTESLGEPPVVPSQREVLTEKKPEQGTPTPALEVTSVPENPQQQEAASVQLVLDAETTDSETQELSDAELDALLEMFEQQALSTLREAVDTEDEELDNTELVDAIEKEYGNSPEIDVLSEVMRRIDEGNTTLDDLIEMVEVSSAIMPDNMPEGTMSFLEMLRNAKAGGGLIVVGSSGGETMFITGTPNGGLTDVIGGATAVSVEFRGDDGTKMDIDLEGATVIK